MITITTKELTRALALCKLVTERRSKTPVLSMIRLSSEGDKLNIQATDLDNYLTVQAECSVTSDIDVLLRPDVLAHFAKHAAAPIEIRREGDNVKLTSGDLSAELFDLIPTEYWPLMRAPIGATVTASEATMLEALAIVRPYIGTEEMRYYLNGAYMHAPQGKLVTVATDGRRIAEYTTDAEWPLKPHILPTQAVKILCAAMKKGNGELRVTSDNDVNRCVLRFEAQGWTLTCKTIDGKFPDYPRVFPTFDKPTITATVSHGAAMAMSGSALDYHSPCVKIDPAQGVMTTGGKHTGFNLCAPVSGEGEAFGLNLKCLQQMTRQHGVIRLEGDSAGSVFWARTDNPNFKLCIMPMRV